MGAARNVASDIHVELLLRVFGRCGRFSEADVALMQTLTASPEEYRAGAELLAEGERAPKIILSGWACRQRVLTDGRRQVFGFLLPGDPVGLCREERPAVLVTTLALTRVVAVDASPLAAAARDPETYPGAARITALAPEIAERRLLDHALRLGRLNGHERVAHLLVELQDRLAAAGLATDRRFPFPVTQETLADAVGLSIVHINRIMQQLRRDGAVSVTGGLASLPTPGVLAAIARAAPPTSTAMH